MRTLLCRWLLRAVPVLVVLGFVGLAGASQAAAFVPVIGVVGTSSQVLRPLDPRTLQPLRGSWSQRVGKRARAIRSPLGTRVAVSWDGAGIVVDSRTGRIVTRNRDEPGRVDLYWFGGETRGRGGAVILYGYYEIGSFGDWYQFNDFVTGADDSVAEEEGTWAVLPRALVITRMDGAFGRVLGMNNHPVFIGENFIGWKQIPVSTQTRWEYPAVADVLHDRIFLIARDGTVAEVDDVSATPRISYHHVDLNGRDFQAAWAGQGRIVLTGADGLGTIDTRTWTTRSISPIGGSILPTPYGIVNWTPNAEGIRVYRPDGTLKFTALEHQVVPVSEPGPLALGRYLYVVADHRTTIDLATGRVIGPARKDARPALPSYVPIP